jgi:hypothetical protein
MKPLTIVNETFGIELVVKKYMSRTLLNSAPNILWEKNISLLLSVQT